MKFRSFLLIVLLKDPSDQTYIVEWVEDLLKQLEESNELELGLYPVDIEGDESDYDKSNY